MFKLILCVIVAIVFITSVYSHQVNRSSGNADQSLNYRLPNNSHPMSYDLWIKTDIHEGNFNFNGRVKMRVKILEDLETLTIHSRDIIIDCVDLFDDKGVLRKSNLTFENVDELEFLVINLQQRFHVDNEVLLDIKYHGTMTNEMSGFYATFYQDEKFQRNWMASTHFLPTNARRAFPCYDEPQIRAPIRLSIQHDKTFHTISNVPVSDIQSVSGSNYVISIFNETEPIQTYLLAFIISKMDFISNKNSIIEQRVYGEPLKVQNGTATFAMTIVNDVLDKFMEILPVSLGLSKIDHVQVPQMRGALEHYGLIEYDETYILLDDNFNEEVKEYFKPQIIAIVTHGLTHQYFGGLVSPDWWQYLWINEGFAMFYQYLIPSLLYPDYDFMDKFRNEIIDFAFKVDVGSETMNDYVEAPLEIQNKFNSIVFEKSSAIVRMFYEALSPKTFTNGLITFLNEMRFKSATSVDLHRALQRAFDADNPDNDLNINSIMLSWETQAGYPVVSVKKDGKNVILTQTRFKSNVIHNNDDDAVYSIPITFTTKTESNFDKTIASSWMMSQSLEINEILSTSDEWIILNIQQVGFYRVDYSRELWDLIIKEYKNNFKVIHHINRQVLHEEMYIAWKYLKTKTASDCLELLAVLEYEKDGQVWEKASQYIEHLNHFLQFSSMYNHFQDLMHKVLYPHMIPIKDPKLNSKLSEEVKRWSRITQHPVYLNQELEKLILFMDDEELDKPEYCSAFRYANSTIYRHFINETINLEIFIDMELFIGLGCSMNSSLLTEFLLTILNPLNKVGQFGIENAILATTSSSMVGLDVVMDLASNKWWELNQLNPMFVDDLTYQMHTLINSPSHYEKFKILTNKLVENKVLSAESTATMLKEIEMKLNDDEWSNIKEWFGVDEEETPSTITTSTCQIQTTPSNAVTLATSIRIIAICISLSFLLIRKIFLQQRLI